MKIYLKVVEKGTKKKLVPFKNQVFCGDPIDPNLNVSTNNKSDWFGKPVGTPFMSTWISKVSPYGKTSYYRVSWIMEITPDREDYWKEYQEFLKTIADVEPSEAEEVEIDLDDLGISEDSEKTEEPAEPKEPTVLENILSDKSLKAPKSKEGFYVSQDDWSLLVRNIQKHVNTMIIGPTGCGKTSVVREICKRMGKKLHIFDMGTMTDPVSSLLGIHRLDKGESIFDYANFTRAIKEPCVILLDELSRAPLSAMNVLFSCLDDRRNLNIEIALGKGEREIDVNPEVTFIATANVGSEYSGTNSMDRALVNRFFPLELGCIPTKEEVEVLINRSGVSKTDATMIVKIANNIRSLYGKQEISTSLSIRETLMVAGLVADGWSIGMAMEMIYLPLYEGTKSEGERKIVYNTISSY